MSNSETLFLFTGSILFPVQTPTHSKRNRRPSVNVAI